MALASRLVKDKIERLRREEGDEAVIATLTPMQIKFVEAYVKDFDKKNALMAGGYKVTEKNSARLAQNLMTHPAVRIAIDYYVKIKAEKSTVTQQYIMARWVKQIENNEEKSKTDYKAAQVVLRASELIAKSLGMFIDRTEITGKDGEAIQIEEINDAADAFTRQIARLAQRERETGSPLEAGLED